MYYFAIGQSYRLSQVQSVTKYHCTPLNCILSLVSRHLFRNFAIQFSSEGKMNDIHSIRFEPLTESNFVKPLRMRYVQNGIQKLWDFNKIHDSVAILIYNITRNVFVFVRQFRPAVYFGSFPTKDGLTVDTKKTELFPPIENGFTLELCAGMVDKRLTIEQIAKEEVLEECGYDVPVKKFEKIMTYREGIGITGDKQTLFYVEVNDDMKVTEGGGNPQEGEMIEVIEMSVADTKKYMNSGDILSPAGFLYALMWFFQNKKSVG